MTEKIYDIIPFKKVPDRFIIVDLNGKLLDDAQGYGYKSILNAHKAATYKFCGGKDKSDAMKKIAKKFWKEHKEFGKDVETIQFYALKDQLTKQEINEEILELAKDHNIDNFDIKLLKYFGEY